MQTTSTSTQKKPSSLLSWWYQLTAIPEPEAGSSFVKRETSRKSRFLSVIVGCLLVSFVFFIPGCLVLPNHYVIVADLGMMPVCVIALVLNKLRRPIMAGILLTIAFEAALTMVVLTSIPFDPPTLQQYELFVFGEVLAVSLITPEWVWAVAAYNIAFIVWSMFFQPYKDAALLYELQTQFWAILVRPVAVQFVVAGVTYLWVKGASGAIGRADKAEMRTQLEIQMREAEAERNEEKKQIQEFIERIVHNHATAMNKGKISKIPAGEYPTQLWPLINVFNSLQNRAQRARDTENEFRQLQQTLIRSTALANEGQFVERPTGTLIDAFVAALRRQQVLRGRGEAGTGSYKPMSDERLFAQVTQQPMTQQPTQPQQEISLIQRERLAPQYQPFDMPPFDQ